MHGRGFQFLYRKGVSDEYKLNAGGSSFCRKSGGLEMKVRCRGGGRFLKKVGAGVSKLFTRNFGGYLGKFREFCEKVGTEYIVFNLSLQVSTQCHLTNICI